MKLIRIVFSFALAALAALNTVVASQADTPSEHTQSEFGIQVQTFVGKDGYSSKLIMVPWTHPNYRGAMDAARAMAAKAMPNGCSPDVSSRGQNVALDAGYAAASPGCGLGISAFVEFNTLAGWGTVNFQHFGAGYVIESLPGICVPEYVGCSYLAIGNYDHNPLWTTPVVYITWSSVVAITSAYCGW